MGAVYVGGKFIPLAIDNSIIKKAGIVGTVVVIMSTFMVRMYFPMILEWFAYRQESKVEETKLKNETLQLENENLKLELELRRQKQLSPPDNQE